MAPEHALDALAHILDRRPVEITVAQVDWARFAAATPQRARLVAKLVAVAPAASAAADRGRAPERANGRARDALASAPDGERPALLRELLIREVRSTMGLDDREAIDLDLPLKQYGLDSLMAVELRNRISAALDAHFPASILFDHPSLGALTEHLLDRLDLAGAPPAPPAVAAQPPAVADAHRADGSGDRLASIIAAIEALSDEDQALLVERLAGSTEDYP
jgi:acyl carrier protein